MRLVAELSASTRHWAQRGSVPVNETITVALVFVALLGLDWRYRRTSVRLGTVALALVVWWFAQPGYTTAARQASAAGPAERSTQLRGEPLSEYMSGVDTMYKFVLEQDEQYADIRLLTLGVLVWLAGAPVVRREREPKQATPRA
jgi:hypothetical protein